MSTLVIDAYLDGTACYYTITSDLMSKEVRRTITDKPEILVPLSQNYKSNNCKEHMCALLGHVQRVGPTEPDTGHDDEGGIYHSWLSGPFERVLMMVQSRK